MNPHRITYEFEQVLSEYTGAPYVIAVDNASNALFLCLEWWRKYGGNGKPHFGGMKLDVPERTYPSVPTEVIRAGFKVNFTHVAGDSITGEYQLSPSPVWDSALTLTSNMYRPGMFQCLSFTGSKKILKLSKGGAILTDNEDAYKWFKKGRFSGRDECSYHDDDFDVNPVLGWNYYMMPEVAARGLLLMQEFPKHNKDVECRYPNLSRFKLWK